jgi:hypothetical protein
MMRDMEHDPTSEDIDRMLEADPDALERLAPQAGVRVHLEVPMDGATLRILQERAEREGRALADVVGDAVRAGAAAA